MLERLQQQLAFTNELIATIGPWMPIVSRILQSIVGRVRLWH